MLCQHLLLEEGNFFFSVRLEKPIRFSQEYFVKLRNEFMPGAQNRTHLSTTPGLCTSTNFPIGAILLARAFHSFPSGLGAQRSRRHPFKGREERFSSLAQSFIFILPRKRRGLQYGIQTKAYVSAF